MDRERLCRGKRVDNGEWVIGYCVKLNKKAFIARIKKLQKDEEALIYVEVIPETVGQYTGLTDKNGNKIFEGDFIKTKKYGKIIGDSNVNGFDIFKVVYQPAVFRLENHQRGFNLVGNGADYDIIGNIHDNPELLEASE